MLKIKFTHKRSESGSQLGHSSEWEAIQQGALDNDFSTLRPLFMKHSTMLYLDI